jgi:hypothetical protein
MRLKIEECFIFLNFPFNVPIKLPDVKLKIACELSLAEYEPTIFHSGK